MNMAAQERRQEGMRWRGVGKRDYKGHGETWGGNEYDYYLDF